MLLVVAAWMGVISPTTQSAAFCQEPGATKRRWALGAVAFAVVIQCEDLLAHLNDQTDILSKRHVRFPSWAQTASVSRCDPKHQRSANTAGTPQDI